MLSVASTDIRVAFEVQKLLSYAVPVIDLITNESIQFNHMKLFKGSAYSHGMHVIPTQLRPRHSDCRDPRKAKKDSATNAESFSVGICDTVTFWRHLQKTTSKIFWELLY